MTPEATPMTLATTMSTTRQRENPPVKRDKKDVADGVSLLIVACTFVPLSKM
jgi:hypothetical protein